MKKDDKNKVDSDYQKKLLNIMEEIDESKIGIPGMPDEAYLIMVGIRSVEYGYDDKVLFENIDYFKRCKSAGLSAYKALLFLCDYLEGDYEI